MNGYFRLDISEQLTAIEIFPPTDGGDKVELSEILSYLQQQKIEFSDAVQLNCALVAMKDKSIVFPLLQKSSYEVTESCMITVSEDKMEVIARFYPPSNGGKRLTPQDIIKDLNFKKITFGIDTDVIDEFEKEPMYCTDYVIAKGKQPVQGIDASIEYFFNTDLSSKPKVKDDGSVDFFNLNTINHCNDGDLLARLTKAVPSTPGADVYGGRVKGRDVKFLNLKHGKNIRLSDDGCEMYSTINGHVSLIEGSVFVSDVYEVENVGPATGNIESAGSVLVTGNVQAGYRIVASGNVEVRGVVEGAIIEAGGDIIINRGVNGMGKGNLMAGGRIIAKFIENATVTSGAYVQAESILLSHVNAKTEVEVDGKRGIIAGGVVRATEKITCKVLGSPMGADTAVEVGIEPNAKERYQFLQKELVEGQKNLKGMKQIIESYQRKVREGTKLSPEQMKYVQDMIKSYMELGEKLIKEDNELEVLEATMHNSGHACIIVNGEIYAGTKVTISDVSMVVKNSFKYCKLIREAGDVRITAL